MLSCDYNIGRWIFFNYILITASHVCVMNFGDFKHEN